MDKEREILIKEIEMYLSHITAAHDYFIAYKTLVDAINNDAFNPKVNIAPAFFSVTYNALTDCLLLELSKLYCDSHVDERTLKKLINKAEANAKLFPTEITYGANVEDGEKYPSSIKTKTVNIHEELNGIKRELETLEPIIKKLNLRRDKKIAHNDKKYFLHPEQLQNESPLLMAELHQLIHFAGKFCNNLLCYLNGGVVGYNSLQTEDLKDLLLKVSI